MACNIIGFQVGFSWSDVKIFTVLALKDGSTMALQSVNFKKALKGKPTLQCTSDLNLAVQKSSPYSLKIYLFLVYTHSVILVIQAIWLVSYLGLWRYIHRARRWI